MPIVSGNGGGISPSSIGIYNDPSASITTPGSLQIIGDLIADGIEGADLEVSADGLNVNVLTPGLYVYTAEATMLVANGATDLFLQIAADRINPNYGNPTWGHAPARQSGTQIDTSATLTAQFFDEFGSFDLEGGFLGGTGPEPLTVTATVFRLR